MKRYEPISNIMITNVTTVHIDQKISDVRLILAENPIHHIPVLNGRKLVGLISATDMMKLNFALSYANETLNDSTLDKQFTIEQVMQKDLVTISIKNTVHRAAEMFCGGHFHSLPVLDEDGNLVGIVTSTDLIMYLLGQY